MPLDQGRDADVSLLCLRPARGSSLSNFLITILIAIFVNCQFLLGRIRHLFDHGFHFCNIINHGLIYCFLLRRLLQSVLILFFCWCNGSLLGLFSYDSLHLSESVIQSRLFELHLQVVDSAHFQPRDEAPSVPLDGYSRL